MTTWRSNKPICSNTWHTVKIQTKITSGHLGEPNTCKARDLTTTYDVHQYGLSCACHLVNKRQIHHCYCGKNMYYSPAHEKGCDGTFVFVTLWIHCLNMIVPCHLLVAHTTPDVHILLLHNTERLPKTEQAGVAPLFVINKRFHRLLSLSFRHCIIKSIHGKQ